MMLFNNPLGQDWMDYNNTTQGNRIGSRIREIRTSVGLSQSELGEKIGLNSDRVQKYENAIRSPKPEMIKKIADALGVETLALIDPIVRNYYGAMHAFFEMEKHFGLKVYKNEGRYYLQFKDGSVVEEVMNEHLAEWEKELGQIETSLESATSENEKEEILKAYNMWKWRYPRSITDRTEKEMLKLKIQSQIDKLQKMKNELD